MTINDIDNFKDEVAKILKGWSQNSGFKARKLTDTPTDVNQVVPKKYVDSLTFLNPPGDATKFLNGAASPVFAQVKDSDLSTSDITTNDVTTSKHGFAPKAPNDTTKFLRGDATWAVNASNPAWVDEGTLTWTASSTDQTLTPATGGKDFYMVKFHMQYGTSSVANTLRLQLSGDTSNNYWFVTMSGTLSAITGPQTSMLLATVNNNGQMSVSGTLFIKGSLYNGLANNTIGVSGVIQPNQLNGTPISVLQIGELVSGSSSLSSLTFLVNGKTVTGQVHVYSLNI